MPANAPTIAPTSAMAPSERVALIVMIAALIVAPLWIYPFFLMQALCFALFACAFNLLVGYVGLLSFGHAMFLGTAGYITAHAAKIWGLTPELCILLGVATAALLGLVVGTLAIRRQGIYFTMITLALAQMIYFVCVQAKFTHGEDGIQAVPQGRLFGLLDLTNQTTLYVVVVVIFLAGFLTIHRTINSPFGEILKAIRENEPRAISLGFRTERYKLAAFVLSASLAGLAGATKSIVAQNASLTDVHWTMSGEVVLMTLVGGLGTVFGPVVGAFVIVAMQDYLSALGPALGRAFALLFGAMLDPATVTAVQSALAGLGNLVPVVQGLVFVVCVLTFRRGVIGEIARAIGRPL